VKFTPGAFIGEYSGKQGSTVASHNRNGPYLRNRAIPVNPNTTTQQNNRNNFSAATKAWAALSSTNKAAWTAAALNVNLFDRLGRAYTPTGHQYFVSCCRTIFVYDATAALPTVPPTAAAPAALLSITLTATSA